MKFVKVSVGNSVSIHDVKVYERRKTEKVTANILGNEKSYCRLTGSQRFGKYYAYFPMEGYNPDEKEAYVELTFDEYTLIATGKEKLTIIESDKPVNYGKRLTGYFTRIENPEFAEKEIAPEPEKEIAPEPELQKEEPELPVKAPNRKRVKA